MMNKLIQVGGVGLLGWVGGILTEKYRNHSVDLDDIGLKVQAAGAFKDPNAGKVSGVIPLPPSTPDTTDSNIDWGSPDPKQNRVSQIMRFGFPSLDQVKSFDDYVLSYDRKNRIPHWVFEHLTRASVKFNPGVDRSKCEFYEDLSVHPFFRSTNRDYKGSGYDRGHMAAAGNHRLAQHHCEQTFNLSNMAPQVGKGFNRDSWNRLEKHIRDLTKSYNNVYVCTGPLYLPRREGNGRNYVHYEVLGPNNVAVPTHFYKVVVAESGTGHLDLEAYIMANQPIDDNTPLPAFQVPVEAIERAAGLIFFDKIQRNLFRHVNGRKSTFL